jgi:hypothetical protein
LIKPKELKQIQKGNISISILKLIKEINSELNYDLETKIVLEEYKDVFPSEQPGLPLEINSLLYS